MSEDLDDSLFFIKNYLNIFFFLKIERIKKIIPPENKFGEHPSYRGRGKRGTSRALSDSYGKGWCPKKISWVNEWSFSSTPPIWNWKWRSRKNTSFLTLKATICYYRRHFLTTYYRVAPKSCVSIKIIKILFEFSIILTSNVDINIYYA